VRRAARGGRVGELKTQVQLPSQSLCLAKVALRCLINYTTQLTFPVGVVWVEKSMIFFILGSRRVITRSSILLTSLKTEGVS
jgi:hypothetical protein